MTVTDRDLLFLKALRRYKFLTTAQLRDLGAPDDHDGRITRDRMGKLRKEDYAHRMQAEVVNPLTNSTAPVWLPTEKGCLLLAAHTGDMQQLLDAQPSAGHWQNLAHYVAVSQFFITLDAALAGQARVTMPALHFEHDILNAQSSDPSKKYRLHTVVSSGEKRVVCVPDAAFEFQVGTYRRAYYLEFERGTDGSPQRVIAKKSPGYAGLAATGKWRLHFPEAKDMRVLVSAPNAGWRDALRRAMKDKPGSELWRFVAWNEITAERFLHNPLFYSSTEGPLPFVRPEAPALSPAGSPPAESRAEGGA